MSNWEIASMICNGEVQRIEKDTYCTNGNIYYDIIGSIVVGLDSKEISLIGVILHSIWKCGRQSDKRNRLRNALNVLETLIEMESNTVDGEGSNDVDKNERVEHPNHYNRGNIECIEALPHILDGLDAMGGFYIGNVIKYMWRWKGKNGAEDLRKAKWYLDRYIKEI